MNEFALCVWALVTAEMKTSFSTILETSQHSLSQLEAAKNMTSLNHRVFWVSKSLACGHRYRSGSLLDRLLGKECHLVTKLIFPGTSQRRGQRHLHVPMTSLGPALHSRGKKAARANFQFI